MPSIKPLTILLALTALVVAGCGSDDDDSSAEAAPTTTTTTEVASPPPPAPPAATPASTTRPRPRGTLIRLGGSQFGRILFDGRKQAIYVFQRDRRNRTNCYGECARLWPPVYTKGTPRAGRGVRQSLLGTIKRRDGRLQVTYRGQPLYFYDHEGPNEVRCHNVFLNGGLWWVVGANGRHLD